MLIFNRSRFPLYLFLFVGLILLTGCGLSPEEIAAQTATQQAALWTQTPSVTPTSDPTKTPAPTSTVTPSPTYTVTPTFTPTSSSQRIGFNNQDVAYSLVPPDEWVVVDDPAHLILSGPNIEGIHLILAFSLDQYSLGDELLDADDFGIALFSAFVQDSIAEQAPNVVLVSEDFLENREGEPYFRWVMSHSVDGVKRHQVFYIFGSGKWFLTVMYGRPKSTGVEYDVLIDQAMDSLKFEK